MVVLVTEQTISLSEIAMSLSLGTLLLYEFAWKFLIRAGAETADAFFITDAALFFGYSFARLSFNCSFIFSSATPSGSGISRYFKAGRHTSFEGLRSSVAVFG